MNRSEKAITVGLVGPCKSGKTLLKRGLNDHGFLVKHIAQEHSYVSDMWQRIAKPDVLIFLEVSYQETLKRSTLSWSENEYSQQIVRLSHAFQHADLIINTSGQTPQQVLNTALEFLAKHKSDNQ
jgi:hypothetical protein